MKKRIFLCSVVLFLAVGQVACGGGGGGGSSTNTALVAPTPTPPATPAPTVAVSASPASIQAGQATTLTWSTTNATSCSISGGGLSGSVSCSGSRQVSPSSNTTYTVNATGTGGTANGTISVVVTPAPIVPPPPPTITISIDPANHIDNNILYLEQSAFLGIGITCSGCAAGDTAHLIGTLGKESTNTLTQAGGLQAIFDFGDAVFVPGPISMWVTRPDGTISNTLWLLFMGGVNIAAADPSTGEIYYDYSGNGDDGSLATFMYKPDGTPDGKFMWSNFGGPPFHTRTNGVAVDNKTHGLLFSSTTGFVTMVGSQGNVVGSIAASDSTSLIPIFGISAAEGIGCATEPLIDSASCWKVPQALGEAVQRIKLLEIPSGAAPLTVAVLDASRAVTYERGDRTLRWYAIGAESAAEAGALALTSFTATDQAYFDRHHFTGGWDLVTVGSVLAVMGQVVNADGTVSQKLALVDGTAHGLLRYADLPRGTIHIAADRVHNAVVAEYPDLSVSPPITRFARIDVGTGAVTSLASTSPLVPGAGFLVTNDGSHVAVFVQGKSDFPKNQ